MFTHKVYSRTLNGALLAITVVGLAVFASAPIGAADSKGKTLNQKELTNLIAHASTKADHERLAQHFDAEAFKYEADAKEHSSQAGVYQSSQAIYQNGQMFSHCDALTKSLNAAAQDARALAAEHRKMAGQAKK